MGKSSMDELFNHLLFLIYVDVNRMSLVKPFGNKEMQKDILERGYRCISHLWETADKAEDYIWRDHGINGIVWDVETRVEKRERLLQIFRYHKGYFWMDNLCMNQNIDPRDKPLEIMGHLQGMQGMYLYARLCGHLTSSGRKLVR